MKKITFAIISAIPIIGPVINSALTSDMLTLHSSVFMHECPEKYGAITKKLYEFSKSHPDIAITNRVYRELTKDIK